MDFQEENCFQNDLAFTDSLSPFGSIFYKNTNTSFSDDFKHEFSNEALLMVVDTLQIEPESEPLATNTLKTHSSESTRAASYSQEAKPVSSNIVKNQVDISKFLYPDKVNRSLDQDDSQNIIQPNVSCQKNDEQKKSGILESVFTSNSRSQTADVFHSSKDMKQIQERTVQNRTQAFYDLTQIRGTTTKSVSNITLEQEFNDVMNSHLFSLFIEEYEHLISKLNVQINALELNPNNLENLIEFKLTIHLIKVISEMMDTYNLTDFSQTVIEFLDDLVEGKSEMAMDVFERLSLVVDYYNYYNDSINKK